MSSFAKSVPTSSGPCRKNSGPSGRLNMCSHYNTYLNLEGIMTLVQRFYAGQKITDQEIISLIPSDEISQGEKNLLMACLFAKTDQEKQAFRNEIGSLQKRN